ncbi:MAG: EAL domain-containing protein [Eubacteriales bacterium]
MKKNGIIWIVLVVVAALTFTSCSSGYVKTYQRDFVLTDPNDLHDTLLDRIDLSYKDLKLTNEELEAIRKYSKYGNVLRAATYEWSGKSEELDYYDSRFYLGVDKFELEAISKILGINIEMQQMELNDAVEKLEAGQIDMIPGIYPTKRLYERGQFLSQNTNTDFIYAYSTENIYIDDITDFEGLKIGVLDDFYIFDQALEARLQEFGIEYKLYDRYMSEDSAYWALRDGKIDIVLQTFSKRLILNQCYSVNVSQIFDEHLTNIMFSNRDESIVNIMSAIEKVYAYNDYMKLLKQDYMEMYAPMIVSTYTIFNYNERLFLYKLKSNPINVMVSTDAEPYAYYDELTGQWYGISYEIWKTVAKAADMEYVIIPTDQDEDTIFQEFKDGNIDEDITVFIPMYETKNKENYFVFSDAIVSDNYIVVGLQDSDKLVDIFDLSNRTVGVINGYDSTNALKNYLPNKQYVDSFTSNDELVDALTAGEIEYIVLSETEFSKYFYDMRYYDLSNKLSIGSANSSIAFPDNEYGIFLRQIFNKVLPFIKSDEIVEEYINTDTDINDIMQARNRDMLMMFTLMFLVVIGFLGFFLRRLSRANKQVRDIAFVNNITGLQNRTAFYNDNTLATGSILYIDIDNFKRINELYGHDIGDMYAFEIAQRISAIAAENQMKAYTMQIDSFLLLDDGTNNEDKLVSIAAKILYEVTKPVRIYDVDHKQTASIGIASKKDERGMEELFKKADTALYLAKERGKNRYVIASEEEFIAYRKRQFLTDQLNKETIQNEIKPYYQAKVDIRDGKIIGIEALARWNAKEQGMIYPREILPVLSENGMLPILDISILTKSCRDYMKWIDEKIIESNMIISCNMSYETIEMFDIVAAVQQIHDNLGMPFRSLEIEIKEADFISHLNVINDKLIELAKLGVNIAIDNFKAEHTIMTQIAKLPVNVIKVDRTLLRGGVVKKTRELLELISTLTSNLNLGLIIEGVETAEQIQLLKEIPIYRVQGYYYGEAVEKAKIENDLRVKYIYR